jgi:peroxiredoxin
MFPKTLIVFMLAAAIFGGIGLTLRMFTQRAYAVAAGDSSKPSAPAASSKIAPDFTLTDQDGRTVKLSDFSGKIVVLEWTNSQCPFVQRHYRAKTMIKLADAYKDKGVVWLAVNSTSTAGRGTNKQWRDSQQIPYPILDDHQGVVGKLYGAKTTPDMFVINTAGQIAYSGAIDDDPTGEKGDKAVNYVKTVLDDLLAGRTPTVTETKSYGCGVKYAK